MTKPISSTTPSPSSHPDTDSSVPQPAALPASRDADAVEAWVSPAAEGTYHCVSAEFGYGVSPDLESIDALLGGLRPADLRETMKLLDENGKLDRIINQMTPKERQSLLQRAIDGKMVARDDEGRGKLVAKQPLTESFQQLVSDFNALGPNRMSETFYNWSANGEGAIESLNRSIHNQIKTLKPGDSVKVHREVAGSALHVEGTIAGDTVVSRDADGKFRVAAAGKATVGPEAHFGNKKMLAAKGEAGVGVGGRVEYTFATAAEAEKAAYAFTHDPASAALRYGKPAAIELRAELTAQLAVHEGLAPMSAFEVKAAGSAQLGARLELNGSKSELVLKASGRVDGSIAPALHVGDFELEVHGMPGSRSANVQMQLETRIPVDLEKLQAKGLEEYLRTDGADLLAKARFRFTAQTEVAPGHHATVKQVSVETNARSMGAFMNRLGEDDALASLGRNVQVDITEKHVELKHLGVKAGGHAMELGLEGEVLYERRAVTSEHSLYSGSAYDLATSPRRSPGAP